MARYDAILEKGKVMYSDALLRAINAQLPSNLRMRTCVEQMHRELPLLGKADQGQGPLARLREALSVSKADLQEDDLARRVEQCTQQVAYCMDCMCANCARNEPRCDCTGCLYGALTTACDERTTVRDARPEGIVQVDGVNLISIETDRERLVHTATLRDGSGLVQRCRLDLATGEKTPL